MAEDANRTGYLSRIVNVHWSGKDCFVLTSRISEDLQGASPIHWWVWSNHFGAATLEDNRIHDFTTGDPITGGIFTFPTNFGGDQATANAYLAAFQGTSFAGEVFVESRPGTLSKPVFGIHTEITSFNVPIGPTWQGDPAIQNNYFMNTSGGFPDWGGAYPDRGAPPPNFPWQDVTQMKTLAKNWRTEVGYDNINSSFFGDPHPHTVAGHSVLVFDLEQYKSQPTIALTLQHRANSSFIPGSGSYQFTIGAFVMRGLTGMLVPGDGSQGEPGAGYQPVTFTFGSTNLTFGLDYNDIPATFQTGIRAHEKTQASGQFPPTGSTTYNTNVVFKVGTRQITTLETAAA